MITMFTTTIVATTVMVSIICFYNGEWFQKLLLSPSRLVHHNEWYRVISHGFVHADYLHLIINMFVLYSFGEYVEQVFGVYTKAPLMHFGILYFGGMVVASLSTIVKYKDLPSYTSVGASGAVSAVLFAYVFLEPWSKLWLMGILPVPGIVFGPLYLWYSSYMGKKGGDNVNHDAHFYGAVFGFLYPVFVNPNLMIEFFKQLLFIE